MKTVPLKLGFGGRQIGWARVRVSDDGQGLHVEAEIDPEEGDVRLMLQDTTHLSVEGPRGF